MSNTRILRRSKKAAKILNRPIIFRKINDIDAGEAKELRELDDLENTLEIYYSKLKQSILHSDITGVKTIFEISPNYSKSTLAKKCLDFSFDIYKKCKSTNNQYTDSIKEMYDYFEKKVNKNEKTIAANVAKFSANSTQIESKTNVTLKMTQLPGVKIVINQTSPKLFTECPYSRHLRACIKNANIEEIKKLFDSRSLKKEMRKNLAASGLLQAAKQFYAKNGASYDNKLITIIDFLLNQMVSIEFHMQGNFERTLRNIPTSHIHKLAINKLIRKCKSKVEADDSASQADSDYTDDPYEEVSPRILGKR